MTGLAIDFEATVGTLELAVQLETRRRPLVLVGPNGSGKTSVLLAILGAIRPRRGTIALDGQTLFDAERANELSPEDRRLGYVPQDYGLFPHMTVLANVAFPLECRRVPRHERDRRALELLAGFDVADLADRRPASLSGGEGQRVALARALAAAPAALLLDEPLAALDVTVRRQLREFLPARLAALDLPAIVVTHDPGDAAAFGDDIAVLERGRIVQRGTIDDLRARPATDFVRELFAR
jgi:ABC-type sulfate/molybdate transport systems ATPase subunit